MASDFNNLIPKSFIIKKRLDVLGNDNKRAIYALCLKEELNITQVSEKLDMSYKSTFDNILALEDAGLVMRKRKITDKAAESFVISIPLVKGSLEEEYYQGLLKEQERNRRKSRFSEPEI